MTRKIFSAFGLGRAAIAAALMLVFPSVERTAEAKPKSAPTAAKATSPGPHASGARNQSSKSKRKLVPVKVAVATAQPTAAEHVAPPADSRSVGSPSKGHLEHGVRFDDDANARFTPSYGNSEIRYGTRELVALIHGAAATVSKRYPGSLLNVGQLSAKSGGDVDRHASHESGRDVDLPFYVRDAHGKPYAPTGFVAFRADGTSPLYKGLRFDVARNWALVSALLQSPHASVSHIFVAGPQRKALLIFAKAHGASAGLIKRASATLSVPKGVLPHDDHLHVRIACPKGDANCVENPAPKAHRKPAGAKHETLRKAPHAAKLTKVKAEAPASTAEEDVIDEPASSPEDPLEKLLSPQVEGLGSIQLAKPREQ